jgi:hypothetical protein
LNPEFWILQEFSEESRLFSTFLMKSKEGNSVPTIIQKLKANSETTPLEINLFGHPLESLSIAKHYACIPALTSFVSAAYGLFEQLYKPQGVEIYSWDRFGPYCIDEQKDSAFSNSYLYLTKSKQFVSLIPSNVFFCICEDMYLF